MNSFVVGNPHLCIGCKACIIACAKAHRETGKDEGYDHPFHPRLGLVETPGITIPVQCRHCENAPCAQACPENAIIQKANHVDVIEALCVGCKSCVLACPFGAISVTERPRPGTGFRLEIQGEAAACEKQIFRVEKCDLCGDDEDPACIKVCPASALQLVHGEQLEEKKTNRRKLSAMRL
jgi:electron transport protein HydN